VALNYISLVQFMASKTLAAVPCSSNDPHPRHAMSTQANGNLNLAGQLPVCRNEAAPNIRRSRCRRVVESVRPALAERITTLPGAN